MTKCSDGANYRRADAMRIGNEGENDHGEAFETQRRVAGDCARRRLRRAGGLGRGRDEIRAERGQDGVPGHGFAAGGRRHHPFGPAARDHVAPGAPGHDSRRPRGARPDQARRSGRALRPRWPRHADPRGWGGAGPGETSLDQGLPDQQRHADQRHPAGYARRGQRDANRRDHQFRRRRLPSCRLFAGVETEPGEVLQAGRGSRRRRFVRPAGRLRQGQRPVLSLKRSCREHEYRSVRVLRRLDQRDRQELAPLPDRFERRRHSVLQGGADELLRLSQCRFRHQSLVHHGL